MIFAAKTTASGLIALLIAFTLNLDQPSWALLTVFIVSQPRQVLAKALEEMDIARRKLLGDDLDSVATSGAMPAFRATRIAAVTG